MIGLFEHFHKLFVCRIWSAFIPFSSISMSIYTVVFYYDLSPTNIAVIVILEKLISQ